MAIEMWQGAFVDFPREMGYPSRRGVVYNMKEFIEKINKYNGKTTIFTSLFAFDHIYSNGKPDYSSARIRHIFFDLDDLNIEGTIKLHHFLIKQNLRHTMNFSGNGFHFFIATEYPTFLKNKKDAIFNAAVNLIDEVGLKAGINDNADIDAHVLGDLARLVRVPNTYNLKRKRFCIPITGKDLNIGIEHIKNLSLNQQKKIKIYGNSLLDLKPFDREPEQKLKIPEYYLTGEIGLDMVNVDSFLPCIKKLLTKKLLSHRERYFIIIYCKQIGLPLKDTILLLKKYLSSRTFYHCLREERQPMWVYRRGDLSFPNCEKLIYEGICIGKEKCKARFF